MIFGIIGLFVGSVAAALVFKRKTTDEQLRDIKARINANAEVAQKDLTRTLSGTPLEQRLKEIKKKAKRKSDLAKLEAYKARKQQE